MKTIAFHSNQLGIRGTEVALYDYAHYNEEILGNRSYIISSKHANLEALNKFNDRFHVFLYDKFEDCFTFVRDHEVTDVYYQKAGDQDGKLIPGVKNLVHAVFQHKDPHGESYQYISKWLAEKVGMPDAYVPYIVTMPPATKSFRQKLGIADDKIVIGRHGGFNEFDLPFVWPAIIQALKDREDLVFIFMNTRQITPPHPRVIFVEGTHNMQNKSNYINTCDYMIHARHRGESFGLAISEFLFHDKPVISWYNGIDQNHIEMLGDLGLWYYDYESLVKVLNELKQNTCTSGTFSNLVKEFTPDVVMKRFEEKFLS